MPGRRAAPGTSPGSRPDGGQLTTGDWFDTGLQTLGMYLDGRGIRHRDQHGRPVVDDSYLVLAARRPGARDRAAARARRGRTATSCVVSTEYPTGAPAGADDHRPGPGRARRAAPSGCSGSCAAPDRRPPDGRRPARLRTSTVLGRCGSTPVALLSRLLEGDDGPAEEQAVAVGERVGDAGLELGPLGGLGPGDVGAVERAEVDQRDLAAGAAAARRAPRRARSGCRRSARRGRCRRSPSRGCRDGGPSTRSSSTVTTMPSSNRSTGAAALGPPERGLLARGSAGRRCRARAEPGVDADADRRRTTAPAKPPPVAGGTAADRRRGAAAVAAGSRRSRARCPRPGRRRHPGDICGAAPPGPT